MQLVSKEVKNEFERLLSTYTTLKIVLKVNKIEGCYIIDSDYVSPLYLNTFIKKDIEELLNWCGISKKTFESPLRYTSTEIENFCVLLKLNGLPKN